jgi:osmotically inducible lipoprotein OsmB
MNISKRSLRNVTAIAVIAAALAAAGCSTPPTRNQIGTAAGAVAGGVAGTVLFGGALGTVGGAAAGALVGNELTKHRR